uniref:Uncharacterized protein n=1 Tax=Stegastes partitus TaxID=144197 RepID=A0A3B5AWU4_9TELE
MPTTKLIKPKPVEATKKSPDGRKPGRPGAAGGAESHLKVAAVRKSRASSCPRNEKTKTGTSTSTGLQGSTTKLSPSSPRTPRKGEKSREVSVSVPSALFNSLFSMLLLLLWLLLMTVWCRLIGRAEAEAELAALEELRLSRAMAYVSINPSSVGGCMSLEEVRLKQQQEMMQAKRKHKPVGQLVL